MTHGGVSRATEVIVLDVAHDATHNYECGHRLRTHMRGRPPTAVRGTNQSKTAATAAAGIQNRHRIRHHDPWDTHGRTALTNAAGSSPRGVKRNGSCQRPHEGGMTHMFAKVAT